MKFKRADIILFIVINVIALFFIFIPSIFMINPFNTTLEIWQDNKLAFSLPLPVTEPVIKEIGGVQFEIMNNKVKAIDANCSDKVCIKTGEINNIGQSIVCLPNRVIAKIIGKSEVDSIAY